MARHTQPIIPDALLDLLFGGADAKTASDKDGLLIHYNTKRPPLGSSTTDHRKWRRRR